MARLFAADIEPVRAHVFDDVSVADLGAVQREPLVGEMALQAEIGHHGRHQSAACQPAGLMPGLGDHRHDLVAVDDGTGFVDDQDPVRVAVERDAYIGLELANLFTQAFGMGRAAACIDVDAVGLVVNGVDFGTKFPERGRRDLVGGAVGAVDDDTHAGQRDRTRQGALGKFDVTIVYAVDALGPAKAVGVGQFGGQVAVQHALDAHFDLVGELVAVRSEKLDAVVLKGVVGGRDHHAEVGAQRPRQHGHGRRRYGAEQEDVHAGGAKTGHEGVFDHVAGQAGILADHHAVAMVATLEGQAGRHPDFHGDIGGHWKGIGSTADTVGTEITSRHVVEVPTSNKFVPQPPFATGIGGKGITLYEKM